MTRRFTEETRRFAEEIKEIAFGKFSLYQHISLLLFLSVYLRAFSAQLRVTSDYADF